MKRARISYHLGAATGALIKAQNCVAASMYRPGKLEAYEALWELDRALKLMPPLGPAKKGGKR